MGHCHAFDLFYQISITPYSGFFHQYVSKIQSGGSVRRRPPSLAPGRESLLRRNGTNGLLRVRRTRANEKHLPGAFVEVLWTGERCPDVRLRTDRAPDEERPCACEITPREGGYTVRVPLDADDELCLLRLR